MTVQALEAPAGRPSPRALLAQGVLLLALLAFVYHHTVVELWHVWTTNDNYSHGPLVPLVTLILLWRLRGALAATPVRPDARGLVLVAAGCLMQVVGVRGDVFALQGYSILVVLFGLVLTACGGPVTRRVAFPLGYLVFMLTFPPILMNQLSFALKEWTVRASTHLAEALGVTLQRVGMTIYLITGEMRIENPCSGLRSLLALLAIGALFAYLQPGSWWRRATLLAAAVPIAMLGNTLRTTLLIVVGHYRDVKFATGAFHDATGYLVYAVALAGLFAVRAALSPRGAPPAATEGGDT